MTANDSNFFSQRKRQLFRFIGWFYFFNSIAFMFIGYPYLKSILYTVSLYTAGTVKYAWYVFLKKSFIFIFSLVNYLVYMQILAFIPIVLLLCLILIIPYKPLTWFSSIVLATLGIICIVIDTQLFSVSEFHINSTILNFVLGKGVEGFLDFSNQEWTQVGVYLLLIVLSETLLAFLIWKKLILPGNFISKGKRFFKISLCGFLFCYLSLLGTSLKGSSILTQQSFYLPYYETIFSLIIPVKQTPPWAAFSIGQNGFSNIAAMRPINYPLHPMQCKLPKKPYNILFIIVDTLRFDMLNSQFMPNTNSFAEENWIFLNHDSGGNGTFAGMTSLIYSIPGTYFFSLMAQKIHPVFYNLLKENHYNTKTMFSASILSFKMFGDEKNQYSVEDNNIASDVSSRDKILTQKAISFLNENKSSNSPFSLTLLYDSVHAWCTQQNIPQIYGASNNTKCSRMGVNNNTDPKPFYNRYLNAVNFVDHEISKLLNVIKKNDNLKDTIIVITADHGEQFNQTKLNDWFHGTNYTHYQIHVPFVVHWPDSKPRTFLYSTTSYDLMPTLFENLFGCTNPVSDYSLGQNLLKENGRLPYVLVTGYFDMGIVEKNRIISLSVSGQQATTRITDKEGYPLRDAKPDEEVVKKALFLFMNKYFTQSASPR